MRGTRAPRLDDPRIMGLLFRVVDAAMENFQSVALEFGLTAPQARALLYLADPAPMGALAGHLACDASNVTGIADRLEAQGMVTREEAEQDRRVKMLALTSRGARVRSELEGRLLETSPFMAGLTESERSTLQSLLAKIAGNQPAGCGPSLAEGARRRAPAEGRQSLPAEPAG